jgi:hypothetical protein
MSDMERLEVRLRAFAAAPDDGADWGDVLRKAGMATRDLPRRKLVLALAAAVVVAGSTVGVLVAVGTGHSPTRPAATGPTGLWDWTDFGSSPWFAQEQTTIEALRAGVPQIPLPNSPSANDGNVGTVWVSGDTASGQVAAAIYYPDAKIELLWTRTGLDYTGFPPAEQPMIDGVHAILLDRWYSPTSPNGAPDSRLSTLQLPVAPDHVLTLEGFVPATELVSVAETLIPSPGASG